MTRRLIVLIVGVVVMLVVLYHLRYLKDYFRRFGLKNKEGAFALSRSKQPFFLLMGVFILIWLLVLVLLHGITSMSVLAWCLIIGLLCLYHNGDGDD
ncbi:hypothetical protein [Streptococcus sp. zg-JUN1979]|uniref:hypothetical protein n=1 Tax=Streptococcus sp. zg-JUN1979 TaxID=3391450 RepID=UPI0039A56B2F